MAFEKVKLAGNKVISARENVKSVTEKDVSTSKKRFHRMIER